MMTSITNPIISILMPVKNEEEYLNECIDSIISQSYKNWELIVVDDHSDDKSLEILSEYVLQDHRIKVYKNESNGVITALRLAYKNARGSYITRMDADDMMTSKKLSHMLNSLVGKGAGHLAIGGVQYFAKGGVGDGYRKYEKWLNGLTSKGDNFKERYKECVIPSPCWMMSSDDLNKCGAFESDLYPEDYDLAFRMYEIGMAVIPCKEILHLWRDYPDRSSRTLQLYSDNSFLYLKAHYFLKLDHNPEKQLVIWGAGKKGKTVVKILNEKGVSLKWVCNNPKKIGKQIYGHKLYSTDELHTDGHYQFIILVANHEEQNEIKNLPFIKNAGNDIFLFC